MTASGVTGKHELGVVEFLGEVGKRGALVIVRGERERDVDRPASREIEAWKRQRGRASSVTGWGRGGERGGNWLFRRLAAGGFRA